MQALQHAATALGWRGALISDIAVLGRQVSAVVRVLPDVHDWRLRNGWPPEPDAAWFRSWFDPSLRDQLPVPAVELAGVLVSESNVDRALISGGTLISLTPCAVVLPPEQARGPLSLIELDYYGIGVVGADADGATVLVHPENRTAEFGPSLFGRWLLEILYDRALRAAPVSSDCHRGF